MRTVSFIALATVSLFAACAADEPMLSSAPQGLISPNGISLNGISLNGVSLNGISVNRITANRITANRITANRITANRLSLNLSSARGLLATTEGRELLGFLISCAIPEDQTLVADFKGNHYEFPGGLGLAPDWAEHPLDQRGQRWVSACMFARVNVNDVSVLISLRGPNKALATSAEERAGWPVQEGAFYGDMFRPLDKPILWIACSGEGQGTGAGGLVSRDCAKPDPAHPGLTLCGFTYAGPCGDFARHHACESFSEKGTFYRDCHSTPSVDDGDDDDRDHADDREFKEVITTYLMP